MASSSATRQSFAGRHAFILAAIGSAVGLGNIWRFPYQAYDNGGGAFLIPYLVALLTAGIPFLMFEFGLGHRYRGSAPVVYRRLHRLAEPIGWWQVGLCFVIATYYAAIIGWSLSYTFFSFTKKWGTDPEAFLMKDHLQVADTVTPGLHFVPGVLVPLVVVWALVLLVLARGVKTGLAKASEWSIPILVVAFTALVIFSLTLPGAASGLNALFTPDFGALKDPNVWMAAYTQIFFSLSVGFGVMSTYASYMKRRTNLTSAALTVGFANSSFEILAGFGVFATLGFLAQQLQVGVNEVAAQGIGLAFVVYPTIINEAPLGALIGVLFFGSLVVAGFTSLVSLVEVVIAAVADKTGWSRVPATLTVGGVLATVSVTRFSTTTSLPLLDTTDAFVNAIGMAGVAVVVLITVGWVLRRLDMVTAHLNAVSSLHVGPLFKVLVGLLTPIALSVLVYHKVVDFARNGYEGYPTWFVDTFGWGTVALIVVVAILLSLIPWHDRSALRTQHTHEDLTDHQPTPDAPPRELRAGGTAAAPATESGTAATVRTDLEEKR